MVTLTKNGVVHDIDESSVERFLSAGWVETPEEPTEQTPEEPTEQTPEEPTEQTPEEPKKAKK